MTYISAKIREVIDHNYTQEEYPALWQQIESWSINKPLQGLSILDNTPVFRNTMTKYLALIAAGAELSVGLSDVMPYDPAIVEFLKATGVNIVNAHESDSGFDIILDCAGAFSHFDPRLGYVELTRSGIEKYTDCKKPVFVADSGKIKRIETLLGTGESLFRALKSLGYSDWKDKKMVVFGSGKVGSGIIMYGNSLGAQISVITDLSTLSDNISKKCFSKTDFHHIDCCIEVIQNADLVVTATGFKNAVTDRNLAKAITDTHALLANMGVEDEFGEHIPESRVLNDKKPLNFILDEPTHLKYIETSMALHNTGALYIANNRKVTGVIDPPQDIEDELLAVTQQHGIISNELKLID